jgi:CRP/FNR family transcriptional regulator
MRERRLMMVIRRPLITKGAEADLHNQIIYIPQKTMLLSNLGKVKKIPKNTVFVKPDDPPHYCYLLKSGCVFGYEYTASGEMRVYDLILPRFLFMEMNLLLNHPSPVYFKTVKPSEIVCIDRHTLLSQISENFQLAMAVIESISYKFFEAMNQVRGSNAHDTTWRFCNLLLILGEKYGVPYNGKILIKEKISQQLQSNLLGVNRVTINRISQKLKDMGLVEQINGYNCIDVEKLKRHMEYMESTTSP